MRRLLTVLLSGSMLLALGCSSRYDVRLNKTLEAMKYTKRLNDNLQDAPKDGPLKEMGIYVRPPKPMVEAKEFGLGAGASGLFDVEKTFFDGDRAFLHVLARVKLPKKAPAKGAPAEAPPAARAPFNDDLASVLKGVFGEEENIGKYKDDAHKPNSYKRSIFTAGGKTVEVYLYKADIYDVALVFVYNPAERAALATKIALCLESFSTGTKARNLYTDPNAEEDSGEASGGGGNVAF